MTSVKAGSDSVVSFANRIATPVGIIEWHISHVDGAWRLARVAILKSRGQSCELPSVADCGDEQAKSFSRELTSRFRGWSNGEAVSFVDVPIACAKFTDFRRRVTNCCRQIGWGETTTYTELARRVGRPGAARAVGRVMASNPLPIVVPCHRVLASNGQLGGFSAPGGIATKRRFLDLEIMQLDRPGGAT